MTDRVNTIKKYTVIITLFARCSKFPELADPPVCSKCCIRTEFGSGLRSLAPLSNSQLSCLPPDNAPNMI